MIDSRLFSERLREIVGTEAATRFAKEVGIPDSTFSRAFNGKEILNWEHLERIERIKGVSPAWLLGLTDKCSELPLNGFASCGLAQGWFSEQETGGTVLIADYDPRPDDFAVYAKGESMRPAGIENGALCIVAPSSPIRTGKPVFVRAEFFNKGKRQEIGSIKLLDSDDSDSFRLRGWLPAVGETGQSPFFDIRPKSAVLFIAPVVRVYNIAKAPLNRSDSVPYNKRAVEICLNLLKPYYGGTNSDRLATLFDILYRKIQKSENVDWNTVAEIMSEVSDKAE